MIPAADERIVRGARRLFRRINDLQVFDATPPAFLAHDLGQRAHGGLIDIRYTKSRGIQTSINRLCELKHDTDSFQRHAFNHQPELRTFRFFDSGRKCVLREEGKTLHTAPLVLHGCVCGIVFRHGRAHVTDDGLHHGKRDACKSGVVAERVTARMQDKMLEKGEKVPVEHYEDARNGTSISFTNWVNQSFIKYYKDKQTLRGLRKKLISSEAAFDEAALNQYKLMQSQPDDGEEEYEEEYENENDYENDHEND